MTGILAPAVFAMHLTACAQQYPVILQAPVQRHMAHAVAESGMRSTAIHDNTTRQSYLPDTTAEAVALARKLLAAAHRIDAGVMQVTDANWGAYGLTVETAFDPKSNICAGARILGEAWQIERRTACRYQTGKPDCTTGYPDMVRKAEMRPGSVPAEAPAAAGSSSDPDDWDVWGREERRERQASSLRSSGPDTPLRPSVPSVPAGHTGAGPAVLQSLEINTSGPE